DAGSTLFVSAGAARRTSPRTPVDSCEWLTAHGTGPHGPACVVPLQRNRPVRCWCVYGHRRAPRTCPEVCRPYDTPRHRVPHHDSRRPERDGRTCVGDHDRVDTEHRAGDEQHGRGRAGSTERSIRTAGGEAGTSIGGTAVGGDMTGRGRTP